MSCQICPNTNFGSRFCRGNEWSLCIKGFSKLDLCVFLSLWWHLVHWFLYPFSSQSSNFANGKLNTCVICVTASKSHLFLSTQTKQNKQQASRVKFTMWSISRSINGLMIKKKNKKNQYNSQQYWHNDAHCSGCGWRKLYIYLTVQLSAGKITVLTWKTKIDGPSAIRETNYTKVKMSILCWM